MLPEFPDGSALPAAAGFGAALEGRNELGKMLADISGHCGAGAVEVELAFQFIGQEGEIKRLAVRQAGGQKVVGSLRPGSLVVAARGGGRKARLITEPLMAQPIELSRTDVQALRR